MGEITSNPAAPDALTQDPGELRRRVQAAQTDVFDARLEYLAQPTKSARKRVKALERKLDAETSRLDEVDPPRLPGAIAPQQPRRKRVITKAGVVAIPVEPERLPIAEVDAESVADEAPVAQAEPEPVPELEPAGDLEPVAVSRRMERSSPPRAIGLAARIRNWLRAVKSRNGRS